MGGKTPRSEQRIIPSWRLYNYIISIRLIIGRFLTTNRFILFRLLLLRVADPMKGNNFPNQQNLNADHVIIRSAPPHLIDHSIKLLYANEFSHKISQQISRNRQRAWVNIVRIVALIILEFLNSIHNSTRKSTLPKHFEHHRKINLDFLFDKN